MDPLKDVKNGESSPQNDSKLSFEQKAQEILDTFKTPEDKKPEEKKSEEKKEVIKDEEKKSPEKEENKIPISRLNKEIEKKNNAIAEIEILKAKLEAEQKRVSELPDEDKDEQKSFKKLGLETKEEKLLEKIEDLQRKLENSDKTIKELEDETTKSQVAKISARITELTAKHDGSDGLPKFEIADLIEFGKKENYMPEDPIKLYNLKFQNEIYAKKFEAKAPDIDKGNKEVFAPIKKKITGFNDPEFKKEAEAILDSFKS